MGSNIIYNSKILCQPAKKRSLLNSYFSQSLTTLKLHKAMSESPDDFYYVHEYIWHEICTHIVILHRGVVVKK